MLTGQENGKSRLQQAQEDVEEVTIIMVDNLNKAEERSGKLDDLENRADDLLEKVTNTRSLWKFLVKEHTDSLSTGI